jgi:hypothetical protein
MPGVPLKHLRQEGIGQRYQGLVVQHHDPVQLSPIRPMKQGQVSNACAIDQHINSEISFPAEIVNLFSCPQITEIDAKPVYINSIAVRKI